MNKKSVKRVFVFFIIAAILFSGLNRTALVMASDFLAEGRADGESNGTEGTAAGVGDADGDEAQAAGSAGVTGGAISAWEWVDTEEVLIPGSAVGAEEEAWVLVINVEEGEPVTKEAILEALPGQITILETAGGEPEAGDGEQEDLKETEDGEQEDLKEAGDGEQEDLKEAEDGKQEDLKEAGDGKPEDLKEAEDGKQEELKETGDGRQEELKEELKEEAQDKASVQEKTIPTVQAAEGDTDTETAVDKETVEVSWECGDYPAEGATTGSFTFHANLPEGKELTEGAKPLNIRVMLNNVAVAASQEFKVVLLEKRNARTINAGTGNAKTLYPMAMASITGYNGTEAQYRTVQVDTATDTVANLKVKIADKLKDTSYVMAEGEHLYYGWVPSTGFEMDSRYPFGWRNVSDSNGMVDLTKKARDGKDMFLPINDDTDVSKNATGCTALYVLVDLPDKVLEEHLKKDKNGREWTASTEGIIDIKMFDYTEDVNLKLTDQKDKDGKKVYDANCYVGKNEAPAGTTAPFVFHDGAIVTPLWTQGYLQNPSRTEVSNATDYLTRGIVKKELVDGFPVLDNAAALSLDFLFDEEEVKPAEGSTYLGKGDYLFHYDEDSGKYTYGSDKVPYTDSENDFPIDNAGYAYYDAKEQRFYVLDYVVTDTAGKEGTIFLPLNYIEESEKTKGYGPGYTESKNYWFGMTMEMEFLQPEGGKLPGRSHEDMIFEFCGDDDVWVFVDDVLVLDLGGIHAPLKGSINFADGKVKYEFQENGMGTSGGWAETTIKKCFEGTTKSKEENFKGDTFADGSIHTLKFFYLERGAGGSNCYLNFNLVSPESLVVGAELEWDESDPTVDKDPDVWEKEKDREYSFRLSTNESNEGGGKRDFGPEGRAYYMAKKGSDGRLYYTGEDRLTKENGYFTLKAGEYAVFNMTSTKLYRVEEITPASKEELAKPANQAREPAISGTYPAVYSQNYSGVRVETGWIDTVTNDFDTAAGNAVAGVKGSKLPNETTVRNRLVKGHKEEGWTDSLTVNEDVVSVVSDALHYAGKGYRLDSESDMRNEAVDENYRRMGTGKMPIYADEEDLSDDPAHMNNYIVFTNLLNPAYYFSPIVGKTVTDGSDGEYLPGEDKVKEKLGQDFQFRVSTIRDKNGDGKLDETEYGGAGMGYGVYTLNSAGRLTPAYSGSTSLKTDSEGRFTLKAGQYAVLEETLGGTSFRVEEYGINCWDFEKVTLQTGRANVKEAVETGVPLALERDPKDRIVLNIQEKVKYGYTNNVETAVTTKAEGIGEYYFTEAVRPEYSYVNIGKGNNQFLFENHYNPILLKVLIGKEVEMETRDGKRVNVSNMPSVKAQEFNFKLYYKEDCGSNTKEAPAKDIKYAVYSDLTEEGIATEKKYDWTGENGSFTLNPGEYAVFLMPYEAKWRVTENRLDGLSYKEETVEAGHAVFEPLSWKFIFPEETRKKEKVFDIPKVDGLFNVTTMGLPRIAESYYTGQTSPKASMILFESQNHAIFTSLYDGIPKTGDETPLMEFWILAAVSAAGLALGGAVLLRSRRKRHE